MSPIRVQSPWRSANLGWFAGLLVVTSLPLSLYAQDRSPAAADTAAPAQLASPAGGTVIVNGRVVQVAPGESRTIQLGAGQTAKVQFDASDDGQKRSSATKVDLGPNQRGEMRVEVVGGDSTQRSKAMQASLQQLSVQLGKAGQAVGEMQFGTGPSGGIRIMVGDDAKVEPPQVRTDATPAPADGAKAPSR
jgi:hypothetical protein